MNPLFSLSAMLTGLSLVGTTALLLVALFLTGSETERQSDE